MWPLRLGRSRSAISSWRSLIRDFQSSYSAPRLCQRDHGAEVALDRGARPGVIRRVCERTPPFRRGEALRPSLRSGSGLLRRLEKTGAPSARAVLRAAYSLPE
jgi:hypothetical protein